MIIQKPEGEKMSKLTLLMGWFLGITLLLAGCESYNLQPGQVPGDAVGTRPGQFPGKGTRTQMPGQVPAGVNSPDIVTKMNPDPQTPEPQITIIPMPNSILSQTPQAGGTQTVADWQVYRDSSYHYQISYPPQYEVKVLDEAELSKLKLPAIAGVDFDDPTRILGGIALSNLNIRVYHYDASMSVEKWLTAYGLYQSDSGWTIAPYQGQQFTGYQVNSSLYMSPGLFIYAVHGDYIYQLTPVGGESGTMLSTFEFTP